MISHEFEAPVYRIPSWLARLYSDMSYVSGCEFVWNNGSKQFGRKAKCTIVGRERDVDNALYLTASIYKSVVDLTEVYIKTIKMFDTSTQKKKSKSYRYGLIRGIKNKILDQNRKFFNEKIEENRGTDIICKDLESRLSEASEFLKELFKKLKSTDTSGGNLDHGSFNQGKEAGEELNINQAMKGQNIVAKIEHKK